WLIPARGQSRFRAIAASLERAHIRRGRPGKEPAWVRQRGNMSTAHRRRRTKSASIEAVAGNGLLHRRALLGSGFVYAGAMSTGALGSFAAAAEPLTDAPWSLEPGAAIGPYERPSRFENGVVRTLNNPNGQPGGQGARTHLINGTITPNGLHFVV